MIPGQSAREAAKAQRTAKPRKMPTPEKIGPLKVERLGEFVVTLQAIENFAREAWGSDNDLALHVDHDSTFDIDGTLPTYSMERRAEQLMHGGKCRSPAFILTVAARCELISVGRYHIRAKTSSSMTPMPSTSPT